ncbi:MAG: 50S ribosomal protein L23 [Victivallaceae bacterium]
MKNPYDLVKRHYVTEKSKMLESLSLGDGVGKKKGSHCRCPKYVFVVDSRANKIEVAKAIEEIYSAKNIKVLKVNTVSVKPKPKRARKGRAGKTSSFKKAIVTLKEGCSIV